MFPRIPDVSRYLTSIVDPGSGILPKFLFPNMTSIPLLIPVLTKHPFWLNGISYKESYIFHASLFTKTLTSKLSIAEVTRSETL